MDSTSSPLVGFLNIYFGFVSYENKSLTLAFAFLSFSSVSAPTLAWISDGSRVNILSGRI